MLRSHLLAGLRLQHSLTHAIEAVIDPSGRVLHAEGSARDSAVRDALRERAIRLDRMRTRSGQRDAAAALEAWTGLVDATWTLVDTFDGDGRRFYIARPNEPKLGRVRALSKREREVLTLAAGGQSNKQIAYALGLAPSTVSSHLRTGMRYLGVRDLAALRHVLPRILAEPA